MYSHSRAVTSDVIAAAEEGVLSWESIARAALCYLSEDEVKDMAQVNGLLPDVEDEGFDVEEYDPMLDYNYVPDY
jgi:hypothetical protein